ncbi:bZIP transcription factor 44-like [Rhododendron vialii]|uniref:bZIP transcription factor 44-like n=1 Tax=Rhododendron vialii TaxID=182163 RepID=UPI00265F4997|nr:bZIP transcription factor 44-like [Rhododendron vialii]
MASSSGSPSSGSTSLVQNSGSEENLQLLMDQRKRKRMVSNRESARRSRMRKQRHLDDLTAQVAELRKENNRIITSVSVTTQQFLSVEGENSILRAQVAELSHRLQSLNEIVSFVNLSGRGNGFLGTEEPYCTESFDGFLNNSWNYVGFNQPIMAETLQY